jgi:hypothetical protein
MSSRAATEPQLDFIRSLVRQNRVSETDLLLLRGDVERLEDLDSREASGLIDWLLKTSAGEIGRLVAQAKGQLQLI